MTIRKIDMGVIERVAPSRGPTSSSDFNSTMEEIRNSLTEFSLAWNNSLQPLLDTLPGGLTGIDLDSRTDTPNPFVNGFDGSQVYTDITASPVVDEGRFYNEDNSRPLTIKETFNGIQRQINDKIQNLEVQIAKLNNESAITARQKQAIGMRIFDPTTESSPSSLDGQISDMSKNIDQLALDISGDQNYLQNSGAQTLLYSILEQLNAIQAAHDYNPSFNSMSHNHLQFHDHRYHITPQGSLDGANRDYYLNGDEEFIPGTLRVVVNGVELKKDIYYFEHPNRKGFTITENMPALIDSQTGLGALEQDGDGADDLLWIHYDIDTSGNA